MTFNMHGMEYWLSHLILLLQIKQGYLNNMIHMMTQDDTYVKDKGETLRLDCEFMANNFDLFDYPVLWLKTQNGEDSQINIMSNINDPFLQTDRYSVDFDEAVTTYKLTLKIKDLREEDSGNYTCQIKGPESKVQKSLTHTLYVRSPVQHILITDENNPGVISKSAVTPSVLTFVEEKISTVGCVAFGGYPPPSMDLFIIGERVTDRRVKQINKHVTDFFSYTKSAQMEGIQGLRTISVMSKRWSDDFPADHQFDNMNLTCVVKVTGYERPKESTVRLSINYAPRITCTSKEAKVGDVNLNITCRVRAKPASDNMFWILDENGTTLVVSHDMRVVNEYWTIIEETNRPGEKQVSLFLREVIPSSFRDYILVAENRVSLKREVVTLQRKNRATNKQPFSRLSDQVEPEDGDSSKSEKSESSGKGYHVNYRSKASAQYPSHTSISIYVVVVSIVLHFFLHSQQVYSIQL